MAKLLFIIYYLGHSTTLLKGGCRCKTTLLRHNRACRPSSRCMRACECRATLPNPGARVLQHLFIHPAHSTLMHRTPADAPPRVGRQAVLRSLTAAALAALPIPILPHPSVAALQVRITHVVLSPTPHTRILWPLPTIMQSILHHQVQYSDAEWAARLPPLSYRVLRKKATERPFTSPLNQEGRPGTFVCAGCGNPLYSSSTKFDSGTGWYACVGHSNSQGITTFVTCRPSFYASLPNAVLEQPDTSIPFLPRTEINCASCGGHLGHVFSDGPPPTGLRYCMNGAALSFVPNNA